MTKSVRMDAALLGVCYYPEHWPESMWDDDYRRMRELGLSVIRVAEFAWSIFEPEEGVFSFDLFDRAIDAAHRHGLKVILGTPTATPPAWLTHKYPEVLNATKEGVIYRHGARRHYNYSSPIYRELCARITRKMAEHYGSHPAVIGWQIDNELNCETNVFYAEADHAAFRDWCKRKYANLAALNEAWGTVFWSQTYTDWEQVRLPGPTPPGNTPNPHQALDEIRFISDNTITFAKLQADMIREAAPGQWVTTNGLFGHLDNKRLTDETLDFISYDSYPAFASIYPDQGERPLLDRKWSASLSGVRAISERFVIMEQQSGAGGWVNRMQIPSPKPGQMRLWTYQSVAHGADMVLYFRWRTAVFGTEIYWHGLNDYHNGPNRRLDELARIAQEWESFAPIVAGTSYRADVAILQNYDNDWDGELDIWHGPLTRRSAHEWHKALQYQHIPADIVLLAEETDLTQLQKYRLLVYPHPAVLSQAHATLLEQYVAAGGTVVFGCRSGYKDERGHCRLGQPFPGPLAKLCGITVEDFTALAENGDTPKIRWNQPDAIPEMTAELFNEILTPSSADVEVIAEYATDYYAGKPALTRHAYGRGTAWYFGAAFSESIAAEIIRLAGVSSPVADWLQLPEQVEVAIRESDSESLVFLLNYGSEPAAITLASEAYDHLSKMTLSGAAQIEPYGVLVLERTKQA